MFACTVRRLHGNSWRGVRVVLAAGLMNVALHGAPSHAQQPDRKVLYDANGTTVRTHLQYGLNAVAEQNLFWDLATVTAPSANFDADTEWLELYLKPGLSFERQFDTGLTLYGKVSAVVSYSWGRDAFDTGNTGRTTPEEYFLGLRGDVPGGLTYDVSVGARELKLGTGMLISNGATSGFERGALKLGPRKAWERALIARLSSDRTTATLFYLDPNELPSKDNGNELAGFDLRHDYAAGGYVGATFVHVLSSGAPYPKAGATPSILPAARNGTNTLNIYAKSNPYSGALSNWTFTTDLAYQRNSDIDLRAWAGRVTAGYTFETLPWSPSLTIGYQTFSGDDPTTPRLERFDPLFYEGSPSAWATGSKSASTFLNSNVRALTLALRTKPSPKDTLTLRYAHIRANELNSPIQFGQATRVDASGNLVSGVKDAHLADDLFLEWSRILNRNTFLTAGLSVSFPGDGIDEVVGAGASTWTGGFVNVVFNF